MPIRVYRCSVCQTTIEVIEKISDKKKHFCKECGEKLEKLITTSNFHLKGSGWYVTDYKNGGKPRKESN